VTDALRQLWELAVLTAPALLTAAAVGAAAAVLGVLVILRRETLSALALPQAVALGSALGFRLTWLAVPEWLAVHVGWPTLPPALVVTAGAVAMLGWARRSPGRDWVLPTLYVGGMCGSVLVVAGAAQHLTDLQNLYVGIDVAVDVHTAEFTVPAALTVGAAAALLWRRWLLLAQAPAAAELAGLRPGRWHALFHTLLAAVVLLGTNALGVVMVLAMLFLPAAAAMPWARRLPPTLALAAALAVVQLVAGFFVSGAVVTDWPLSHCVGAAGVVAVALSHTLAALRRLVPPR
jgi:zinc transport system permease protein